MQISVPGTRFHWYGAGKFPDLISLQLFQAFFLRLETPTDVYTQFWAVLHSFFVKY